MCIYVYMYDFTHNDMIDMIDMSMMVSDDDDDDDDDRWDYTFTVFSVVVATGVKMI